MNFILSTLYHGQGPPSQWLPIWQTVSERKLHMYQRVEARNERVTVRMTPSEKLALHRIARKHGGLSSALRYMVNQYGKQEKSTNAKSADQLSRAGGALQNN